MFVSHSTLDRGFVEDELVPFLNRHGIRTWCSGDGIESASQWERSIRTALNACDWFLVVMTQHALGSRWVRAEVHWAMEHRAERFVPLLVEDCDWSELHLMIQTIQCAHYQARSSADKPNKGLYLCMDQ